MRIYWCISKYVNRIWYWFLCYVMLLLKTQLTHWGRVTHKCVGILTIIGPDNGLSPGRRQAIIWTNAGILLIGPWGTNFSDILIGIQTFSFKKRHLKMSSAKWRPFCLGLNVLNHNTWMPAFLLPSAFRHITSSPGCNHGALPSGLADNKMIAHQHFAQHNYVYV